MEGIAGMRKGWFKIPGVQDGDRTAEEQLLGLAPVMQACRGKSVLDLGSAEGLISAACARAGATRVLAVELLADHVSAARKVCRGLQVELVQCELGAYIRANPEPAQFDVVLALGIAHKLHDPAIVIAFAAKSARELLVFRGPGKKEMFWDGWLSAKFGDGRCHVPTIMAEHGLVEGETLDSTRGERVQYWHRKPAQ